MEALEGMSKEELINATIDKYTELQQIKKANGNYNNPQLDYYIKATIAQLSSFGVSVEDITF